jgi:hypothetical protein
LKIENYKMQIGDRQQTRWRRAPAFILQFCNFQFAIPISPHPQQLRNFSPPRGLHASDFIQRALNWVGLATALRNCELPPKK